MQNIASINATKDGKYFCTVLTAARGAHLQGSFCIVPIRNGHFEADVLCRAGIVNTHNQAHESMQFQLLIAKRGRLEHVSAIADVEQSTLEPLAFFDLTSQRQVGSKGNPLSGTLVYLAEMNDLDKFRREAHYAFAAGYVPGHPQMIVSLINRDYGAIEDHLGRDRGGYGEARNRIYLGKTGSGKTVFAFQGLCAHACQHSRQGILMLDTKGDIVVEGMHIKPGFRFDPHQLLRDAGRLYEVISIRDIRLTEPDWMIEHLGNSWPKVLGKAHNIVEMVLEQAITNVMETGNLTAVDLQVVTLDAVRTEFVRLVRTGLGWSDPVGSPKREQMADELWLRSGHQRIATDWQENIVPIYAGTWTAHQIVRDVLNGGAIRMVNLHGAGKEHQDAVMVDMLKSIKRQATTNYHARIPTNAEVFLDEAPRWVPQDHKDNPYAAIIIDAINTTRAYGVGWTFCSQRLTAIDKSILAQTHTRYYCKGLGVGADRDHMIDDLGMEGFAYYNLLNLENSYFSLVSGEELNFGSGGQFMAYSGWSGDVNAELKAHNTQIWQPALFPTVIA
jgi:hypothetical protein